jgi:hypothetical protein
MKMKEMSGYQQIPSNSFFLEIAFFWKKASNSFFLEKSKQTKPLFQMSAPWLG